MTVSTTDTEVSYTADGVQTNFSFNFVTQLPGDIDVYVDGQLLLVGVIVNLNADQETSPGGSVDITPAPADTLTVEIKRNTSITQETDYDAYDPFPAKTHENALDKLTLISQEQSSEISAIDGKKLEWVAAPTTASDTGTPGQVAYDSSYFYVCVSTDTWVRTLLETW